ncbi:MAG: hypothetical protein PHH54_03550 [Candidatus Nanoarchaeia archaeon]|nr:hypothetical protein [Candidatus Nanoarchaeia archaeon]MDD5741033.1 hypothetical protein [Candidatus Nanoarchaeia archaeon]
MNLEEIRQLKAEYMQALNSGNYKKALESNKKLYEEINKIYERTQNKEEISNLTLELMLLDISRLNIETLLNINS